MTDLHYLIDQGQWFCLERVSRGPTALSLPRIGKTRNYHWTVKENGDGIKCVGTNVGEEPVVSVRDCIPDSELNSISGLKSDQLSSARYGTLVPTHVSIPTV